MQRLGPGSGLPVRGEEEHKPESPHILSCTAAISSPVEVATTAMGSGCRK